MGSLVGRHEELRQCDLALDGGAVLLMGEAGIGKSRLAAELAAQATRVGHVAVTVACLPLAGRLPLLPVVDMVRGLLVRGDGTVRESVLHGCPAFVREDVARLVPELSDSGSGPSGDEWLRQRLFVSLAHLCRSVQAQSGLTVVVEDVHWSDPTTRDFLTYLIAHLAEGGWPSLVMTVRSEESVDREVREWLHRLSQSALVRQVILPPLSESEVAELAGSKANSVLSSRAVAELFRRTGGNPFFVEQLLAAETPDVGAGVPEPLAMLLRDRARASGGALQRVLTVLAVAARPMAEGELSAISGQDTDTVRQALRVGLARQLVRRTEDGFAPRHALLGEALIGELLVEEAAELHGAVATALDQRNDPRVAAETATHWAAAGRPDAELRARVAAAEYAESVFAFREAAAQWERSVNLAVEIAVEEVPQLALRGMEAWASAGNSMRAVPLLQAGLRSAGSGDPMEPVRATLLLRLAMLQHRDDLHREIYELTHILETSGRLIDPADQVAALTTLYFDHRALAQNRVGLPLLYRAVEIGARSPKITGDYVEALSWLAYEQDRAGDGPAASATLARARDAARQGGDLHRAGRIAGAETRILLFQNRLEEVVEAGLTQLKLLHAQGYGDSPEAGLVAVLTVEALLQLGDVDAAEQVVDMTSDDQRLTVDGLDLATARCRVDVARGQLSAARARLDEIYALAYQATVELAGVWSRIDAEIALWSGDPAAAAAAVKPVIHRLMGTDEEEMSGMQLATAMQACADLAQAAAARRDPTAEQTAAALRDELVTMHAQMATGSYAEPNWRAELARSRNEDTATDWDAAATHWQELRHPHDAAYARWRQAEVLLKSGERTEATIVLKGAWQLSAQHRPLRAAITNLARMARIDLVEPDDRARNADRSSVTTEPTPYGLTARELEVLRLLVDGLTNAQIGARLYLSPKTVSVHVTAILRKLQATNRVHAAAIAQRGGLTASN